MPWVVVWILFSIWAFGILKGYFGEYADDLPPDAMELSLINFDRSKRVEDSVANDPQILRWLLGSSDDQEESEQWILDGLEYLDEQNLLDPEGRSLLGLIRSDLGETVDLDAIPIPIYRDVLSDVTPQTRDVEKLAKKLSSHQGKWWDAEIARKIVSKGDPSGKLQAALTIQDQLDQTLKWRAMVVNGTFWLIYLMGACFVPYAYRKLKTGWMAARHFRPIRYHSRWEPSLILAVFLGCDIVADKAIDGLYSVAGTFDTGYYFDAGADLIWRMIPPLLAAGILFARPRHVLRAFGMNRWPDWRIVLVAFALLAGIGFVQSELMGSYGSFDPTGNLDSMEIGWRGLIYGLLSSAVAAPIAEEMFFRGLLARGLEKRYGFPVAAICVTGLFALVHFYDWYGFVSVAVFGFTALVIYRATGSLINSIALHALYNFSIILPAWVIYYSHL
ncbi:CPBP family intramembrane metalloprotease [Luteolibacter pohnpeiensis]|uniref:CPBP family intramembrane metalloprotease n=1 Tax=Luteolibacter pohnpeiensis TaxID=454153 RepID=A0A934S626_9BACT|nr:type II CAAX endopeptidase family protein [Luteolibacter pohnpeiensis]MBK1881940.1 CPBP family intramembrane metalloprotease [Luteolibacter pohnpeiensis]